MKPRSKSITKKNRHHQSHFRAIYLATVLLTGSTIGWHYPVWADSLVSVSGTVFHDYSANVVLDNDLGTDTGTNANSANLTVYAVNSSGMVVDKATVSATGVYTLSNVPQNSNVTLRLSDDASVAVGASAPTSPSLPSGWYNTGQNLNGTIVPTVGTTNATSIILGNIALSTTTTNITNRDFGIRQGYAVAADPEPTTCQVNFTSELTTGISSTGGQLAIGSKDLNWSSEWISGSSGANTYATPRPVGPMPAVVTGNNQPSYWRNEPGNARWISYPFRLSTNADGRHPDANLDGVQTGYWQYPDAVRLKFTAKVTVPANAITTNITLPLGVSVDNQFVSLKVNGVENLSPVPNPPNITAADYGSLINVNLNQGWQTGVNTIEIIMDSGPWAAGFFVGVNATSTSLCGKDYGDAPATYGSPSHSIATGLQIGSTAPDAETAPVAPLDGTGDGADETGLVLPTLSAGATTYQIPNIPVTNSTGSAAKLVGWIDFNNNGVFDSNEAATVNVPNSGAQTVTLNWSGLSGVTAGNTYARFRLTSDATVATGVATTSSPTVAAFDGEVEDYAMTIAPPAPDLTLSKSHAGNFTVGSPATYTFRVNNTGTAATTGTITVTDTLPTGLTKGVTAAGYNTGNFAGTNGTTWNCLIDPTGKIITCTSTSVIAAGSSASFDLTGIQVDSTAPNPVINTATVSGGGQTNTTNDNATDSATVQTTTAACSLQSQLTNTLDVFFNTATLESGTANTAGAVYRFSNVATGIDALVTLETYQGTNITAATIPVNLGASITANPEATYQYKVVLVKTTTSIPIPPRDFVVTGFDIDGNSGNTVSDFAGFVNPDGYFVNSPTQMQTTLTATGVDFTNLDTGFNASGTVPAYAAGAFFFKTNTFTVRGGLRNASAAANRGTSFGVQASKLSSFTSLNCQTFPRTSVVIYGNVFKDTNSNKVQDGAETAYTTAGINAVLVDSNNKVIATTPIAADGSYTFDNIPSNANYTVLITTNTATVGAAPPAILLPSGWQTSGENINGAIDGTADSTISLAVNTANVVGANFGLKVAGVDLSGTVFEDPNYGGGAGRPLSTPNTSPRDGAIVELYKSDGTYVGNTITSGGGQYTFSSVTAGDYFVRVVNSTVTSSRPGAVSTLVPVQTFRVNDSTGTPADDGNRVGGEKPSVADTGAAGAGAVLSPTTFAFTTAPTVVVAGGATVGGQAQSIAPVKVGSSAVTGIDFGYNFDTIVNTNNSGQGSLRQFITNSNALTGESSLAQAGSRVSLTGGNEALPAEKESSIFMIPAASLTATNGVAVITPTAILPDITGTSTYVDATTQTVNIGNTNTTSTLGSSVTVGTGTDGRSGTGDETTLNPLPAPEVQIVGQAAFVTGLNATANDFAVRGISIYGFGSAGTIANFHGQIVFRGVQDFQAELNAIGVSATSTSAPAVVGANGIGTMPTVPNGPQSNLYVRNNLIANTGNAGIYISGQTSGAPIPSTESVSNAIIEKNILLNNGSIAANTPDGMTIEWCGSGCKISKNYIDKSFSFGIQLTRNTGLIIDDNTITTSGRGNTNELSGIGSWSSTLLSVTHNILANNKGAGILASRHPNVNRGNNMTNQSTFSQNSMYGNGNLGIDLFGTADGTGSAFQNGASLYVTPNDGLKEEITARSNAGMDYPIITSSTLSSGTLRIKGFVGAAPAGNADFAGAKLEFFVADDDGNQNGPVIIGDGKSKPHGEGKTYIGDCLADGNGLFNCTFANAGTVGLTSDRNITATATDVNGNTSEFSAVPSDPAKVELVKRITAINGLTTNPNDGTSLTGFVDDGTPNNADNNPQWPSSSYLAGAINGGKIKPGDEIEYTIYYLNSGVGDAKAVRICDRLDTNLNYVSDFDASNSGKGISFTNPSGATSYLTNTNTDSDRGEFVASNGAIPQKCNLTGSTNPSGIVVVDVANSSNLLLPGGRGYIKFKTTVK